MSAEPRYSSEQIREDIDRERYARELAATYEALARPIDSMPSTELELAELQRLITRYPAQARQFVAGLPPPA